LSWQVWGSGPLPAHEGLHILESLGQAVELGAGGVGVEAGPDGGGDLEMLHHRLGAVVAGPDSDAFLVKQADGTAD